MGKKPNMGSNRTAPAMLNQKHNVFRERKNELLEKAQEQDVKDDIEQEEDAETETEEEI